MKTVKLFSITALFFIALIFEACNPHAKNKDTDDTLNSEGLNKPYVNNSKDSAMHNDTIITPPDDNSMNKNNPDITK